MKKRFIRVIIITAAALAVGCSFLLILKHFGLHLPCVIREISSGRIKCPTCGATRALMSLLGGDIKYALFYNPMIFLIGLYLARIYIIEAYGYIKNGHFSEYKLGLVDVLGAVIMVVWVIFRNIFGL